MIELYDVPGMYEAEYMKFYCVIIFYLEMLSVYLNFFPPRNPQWSLYLPVAVPVRRTTYMCSVQRYTYIFISYMVYPLLIRLSNLREKKGGRVCIMILSHPLLPKQELIFLNCSCFKARQEYILESRRIREEQDREYQESLRIDREKEEERQKAKADQAKKEQVSNVIMGMSSGGTKFFTLGQDRTV